MVLGSTVGLVLAMIVVIFSVIYLIIQAGKRRKTQQRAAKVAEKAEAVANRAAWQKWRKK